MRQQCGQMVWAIVLALSVSAFAQMPKDAAIAKAEAVLKHLQDGNAAELAKELDAKVAEALPEVKLKAAWPSVVGQFGAFKSIVTRREGQYQDRQAVELLLAFEKQNVIFRTVFGADGKVGGLVFRPPDQSVFPAEKPK